MNFFDFVTGWSVILGILATGIFAGVGIFDSKAKKRQKDANDTEDRVIDLLKSQVEILEGKVNKYESEFEVIKVQLQKMSTENEFMRSILQGSDEASKDYRKHGMVAMKQIDNVEKLLVVNGHKAEAALKLAQNTSKNVEKLYKVIEKHLEKELELKAAQINQ